MGLYCILCGRKDKSVSYLRFPSNKHIRKQWLNFCKKSEKNLYDSHRLCTDHFKPEDLKKRSRCVVVQAEAVPCIYSTDDDNICSTGIMNSDLKNDNIIAVNYSQSTTVTENIDSDPAHCTGIGNCEIPLDDCLTSLIREEDAHCSSKKERLDSDFSELVSNDGIDSTIPIQKLPVSALTPAICDSAPPMILDPRYVGDIQLSHLATPRQATKAINVMRRTVTQQRQKIETLQKKFSRCKQRISLLKDLVSDLKKRNYISETAANILMVRLNKIYLSMKAPNKAKRNDHIRQKYSKLILFKHE
ncbi:uncharacterized protein LOC115244921 [Formica exsecta]|uniref:uncharacterized protein LOC115244921 n=1 Tax=Formica exsecta TaxID=72781 RepID=UPI00114390F3|nr:uncharacterized protein LOC115244921 [Formica exsecta]